MERKVELEIEAGGYLREAAIRVRDARKAWDADRVIESIKDAQSCLERALQRAEARAAIKPSDEEIPF